MNLYQTKLKQAAEVVLLEGRTVSSVAKQFDVCRVSLHRLTKKTKGSTKLEISYLLLILLVIFMLQVKDPTSFRDELTKS